jgi:hypothetical protein
MPEINGARRILLGLREVSGQRKVQYEQYVLTIIQSTEQLLG